MDTKQLYTIELAKAYFVVREKRRMVYETVEDKNYNNPETGVMSDTMIKFTGIKTKKQYLETMRKVVFYDKDMNRTFVFYTNNKTITAEDVALLYKHRWSVELFFKWMKQHLRIKEFYGTTENAVKIQVYAAIITYCLVAIIETQLAKDMTTYEVLRVLSTSLLVKMPLTDLLQSCQEELLKENENAINEDKRGRQLELPFEEW